MGIPIYEFYVEEFIIYGLEKFLGEFPCNTINFLEFGYDMICRG